MSGLESESEWQSRDWWWGGPESMEKRIAAREAALRERIAAAIETSTEGITDSRDSEWIAIDDAAKIVRETP